MTTWSKTPEQMGIQPCEECGENTSAGSGKYVNRIPYNDGWLCPDCLNDIENEFEKENDKMIDGAITTIGFALQSHVNTCYHEDTEENKAEREEIEVAWSIIKEHLKENDNE